MCERERKTVCGDFAGDCSVHACVYMGINWCMKVHHCARVWQKERIICIGFVKFSVTDVSQGTACFIINIWQT